MHAPAFQPGLTVKTDRAAGGDSILENKASSMEARIALFSIPG